MASSEFAATTAGVVDYSPLYQCLHSPPARRRPRSLPPRSLRTKSGCLVSQARSRSLLLRRLHHSGTCLMSRARAFDNSSATIHTPPTPSRQPSASSVIPSLGPHQPSAHQACPDTEQVAIAGSTPKRANQPYRAHQATFRHWHHCTWGPPHAPVGTIRAHNHPCNIS